MEHQTYSEIIDGIKYTFHFNPGNSIPSTKNEVHVDFSSLDEEGDYFCTCRDVSCDNCIFGETLCGDIEIVKQLAPNTFKSHPEMIL